MPLARHLLGIAIGDQEMAAIPWRVKHVKPGLRAHVAMLFIHLALGLGPCQLPLALVDLAVVVEVETLHELRLISLPAGQHITDIFVKI